jgi:probable HAF family extracellular repeat protein
MRLSTGILLAVVLAPRLVAAVEFEFISLGNLRGAGEFGKSSQAHGVSADGQAVVGVSLSSVGLGVTRGEEAFLWVRPGPMRGLDALSPSETEYFSAAYDVSDQGRVVVGESQTDGGRQAFRWTQAAGMVSLGTPALDETSIAYGVSADGKIIVGTQCKVAFRWTEEQGMTSLGDLPGGQKKSTALAVSSDGKVVVGCGSTDNGTEAFRWTAETGLQGLGNLTGGGLFSAADGVSRDGSVIVGTAKSDNGTEAFRWTATDGMTALGDLPDGEFSSAAHAVSGDGKIVVGRAAGPSGPEAFLWTAEQGMQSLGALVRNIPAAAPWRLTEARDISDDATVVVGIGINPEKQTAAWLIRRHRP